MTRSWTSIDYIPFGSLFADESYPQGWGCYVRRNTPSLFVVYGPCQALGEAPEAHSGYVWGQGLNMLKIRAQDALSS